MALISFSVEYESRGNMGPKISSFIIRLSSEGSSTIVGAM